MDRAGDLFGDQPEGDKAQQAKRQQQAKAMVKKKPVVIQERASASGGKADKIDEENGGVIPSPHPIVLEDGSHTAPEFRWALA